MKVGKLVNIWLLVATVSAGALAYTPDDSLHIVLEEEPVKRLDDLDSLTSVLFANANKLKDYSGNKYGYDTSFIPSFHDTVVIRKMGLIPAVIPLDFNEYVKRYIEVYSRDRHRHSGRILGLSEHYFPMFEQALDRRGMPIELKYLAIVESALNPNAVSKAGATGLWQIIYTTGRMLDLNINSYIDERRDPHLATEAALDYLSKIHDVYGDWLLVIAAYNCGPGNVNKAIQRSGGKKDFWAIRDYLPRETRSYVPAFVAATYVFNYFEDFNIRPELPTFSFNAIDTVMVHKRVSLSVIAEYLNMDEEELAFMNPALRKRTIPALAEGYALKIPLGKIAQFEANRELIFKEFDEQQDNLMAEAANRSEREATHDDRVRLVYTVKSGDNLSYIADWYGCTSGQIQQWNAMRGTTIHIGQRLNIYVRKSQEGDYRYVNQMSRSQKNNMTAAASPIRKDDSCNCVYYEVKPGDTLWGISQRHPGATIENIKRSNNISDTRNIKPGMVLKIQI